MLRDWEWFGLFFAAAIATGIGLHLFWRFKTKGWGGWNDIE